MTKARVRFAARCALSALLVLILFRFARLSDFGAALGSARLPLVLAALACIFLDRVLMAYRLLFLLREIGVRLSLWEMTKLFFVSNFVGNVLPSSAGPDVVRAYLLREQAPVSKTVPVIFVDRVIGLASQMLLVFAAFLATAFTLTTLGEAARRAAALAALGFVLLAGAGAVFLRRAWMRRLGGLASRVFGEGILLEKAKVFYATCCTLKDHPGSSLRAFGVSFLNHTVSILSVYLLARAVWIEVPLLYFFILCPVIHFLVLVPISINGLGLQEGAYVVSLARLGVPQAEAFLLSLMLRVVTLASTLPGSVFYLARGTYGESVGRQTATTPKTSAAAAARPSSRPAREMPGGSRSLPSRRGPSDGQAPRRRRRRRWALRSAARRGSSVSRK
jgi:hypothetical protein